MTTAPRGFTLRDARPDEYDAVGAQVVDAYRAVPDHTGPFSAEYEDVLRDVADRARTASVVVAVDDATGAVLGSVTLAAAGTPNAHVAQPGEWEFRMLGVDTAARGRGVGTALVEECAFRAGLRGGRALVMSVYERNDPAARMYERLGFTRVPSRDWEPEPGIVLQVSSRTLFCVRDGEPRDTGGHEGCDSALELEPPRFCPACRRRMVVQVSPNGYRATCSAHGTSVH